MTESELRGLQAVQAKRPIEKHIAAALRDHGWIEHDPYGWALTELGKVYLTRGKAST